jgi:hypothetical protein
MCTKYSAEWRIVRLAEREVEFAVERIEPVIHRLSQGIGLINFVRGTDFVLRLFHGGESAGGQKCAKIAEPRPVTLELGTRTDVCRAW